MDGNEMTSFVEKLYDTYSKEDNNFLLSPYSIRMALCMTREGSDGVTKEEMDKVLGDRPRDVDVSTVNVANAIWVRHSLKPEWVELIKTEYNGEATDIGHVRDPVALINQWASDKTNGKIPKILSSLSPDERLVITNAVYFKDDWLIPFKKVNKDRFFYTEGKSVDVDMMHLPSNSDRELHYAETEAYQALQLFYRNSRMSMIVLLPKQTDGRITGKDIVESTEMPYYLKKVDIYLPKILMECTYTLNRPLMDMGMVCAFTDYAEFPGTSEIPLKISAVIHKTYVDINEKGTEAAAVTAVVKALLSSFGDFDMPILFRADHPYAFLIRDRVTNEILFVGSVNNPIK